MLEGIRIIDFTRLLPGPVATHMLAQMGADVRKMESPRRMDYARQGLKQVDGASSLFHQLNHNKTLCLIDYETSEGLAEVKELIRGADALIEQFRPGAMAAWGLDYESLKVLNPKLVYVSMTGYGQTGELAGTAGHDANYLAQAGLLSMLKDETGKPIIPGFQLADVSGAYSAVMAIQAALIQQLRTGKGACLDVSLCAAALPFLTVPYSLHSDGFDHRRFNLLNGTTAVNYAVYACADGNYLAVAALELKFWNGLCEALGKSEWQRTHQLELMRVSFPYAEVEALFRSKPRAEWLALLEGNDVCVSPIVEMEALEESAYHQQQAHFPAFETSDGTRMRTIALPFRAKE
jgi:crotonobetainyl-CoA:carnitine CoA-transferase CaiB-like acyl-CoA transferase